MLKYKRNMKEQIEALQVRIAQVVWQNNDTWISYRKRPMNYRRRYDKW